MLTPTHQALHNAIKQAPIVHVDETTHHRNNLTQTLWVRLASADDIVFQKIMSSRRQECVQYILGKKFNGIAVTDQCDSYNWIDKNNINSAGLILSAIYKKWRITVAKD
ncbi:MAG: transposase [Oleiphilaceae bacterium]|jgi:transposase